MKINFNNAFSYQSKSFTLASEPLTFCLFDVQELRSFFFLFTKKIKKEIKNAYSLYEPTEPLSLGP